MRPLTALSVLRPRLSHRNGGPVSRVFSQHLHTTRTAIRTSPASITVPRIYLASYARSYPHSHIPALFASRRTLHIPSRKEFSGRYPVTATILRLVMSTAVGLTVLTGVVLLHDAFTYSERHVDRVPSNPLSIHPRTGGPKNLPIIEVNLDDEDEGKKEMAGKPRLVIIGGGWGVSRFLSHALPILELTSQGCVVDTIPAYIGVQRYPHFTPDVLCFYATSSFRLRWYG
jgi:hypothetical protein